jgi:putative ABC transport system permease protein
MTRLDFLLASRNVLRQGIRSAMPLLVVALSSYVIILVGGLYQDLFDSLEKSVVRSEGHLKIEAVGNEGSIGGFPKDVVEQLNAIEEIRVISLRSPISGVLGFGEQSSIFSGYAIDPVAEQMLTSWPSEIAVDDASHESENDKATVGSLLAQGLSLKVGDWISGIAGDASFAAEIGNIVKTDSEEQDRFFLKLPYASLGGVDYRTIRSVHIQVKDPTLLPQCIEKIKAVLKKAGIKSVVYTEYTSPKGYISSVKNIYGDNLRFIMIVLSVTVFFSIATAFTLAITERTKELGTMRSFGAQENHISTLFQIEALYLSFYGFVVGSLVSILTGILIKPIWRHFVPPPPTVQSSIVIGYAFNARYR